MAKKKKRGEPDPSRKRRENVTPSFRSYGKRVNLIGKKKRGPFPTGKLAMVTMKNSPGKTIFASEKKKKKKERSSPPPPEDGKILHSLTAIGGRRKGGREHRPPPV